MFPRDAAMQPPRASINSRTGSAYPGRPEPNSTRISSGSTIPDPVSVEELGRTFQGYREGRYMLPNDGAEQDRLDLQHHIWLLLLDGHLKLAPVQQPKNVLDIATGTGIWALEFARTHTMSKVVGTDLSLIQPSYTPSNCLFIREDSEEDWVHNTLFDYIHLRMTCTCFSDARAMMTKIFDNLTPGGWVEYQDASMVCVPASREAEHALATQPGSIQEYAERLILGMDNLLGRPVRIAHLYRKWLIEVGFVDVVEKQFLVPSNGWPLDPKKRLLGKYFCQDNLDMLKSSVKILLGSGLPQEELESYSARVRDFLTETSIHVYSPWYIVYGRKPFS